MAETTDKMTTDAIEAAAKYLTTKVEKRHKKHVKDDGKQQGNEGYSKIPEECLCDEQMADIEEGTLLFERPKIYHQGSKIGS